MINKRKIPLLLMIGLVLWLIVLWLPFLQANQSGITDFTARTEDEKISLSWKCVNADKTPLKLTVRTEQEETVIVLPYNTEEYEFENGQHGKLYSFEVSLSRQNSEKSTVLERLFLDWEKIPDLPLVQIETVNGIWPSYTVVETPSDCWGSTITQNEYVQSRITITNTGTSNLSVSGGLRYRGNTSTALSVQKSYAIKLDNPLDLLSRDDTKHADRRWGLIPGNNWLKTECGLYVSQLCRTDWQPKYIPVNLIINGDWQGQYLLIETVNQGSARVDIEHDGFLIENSAYWWKPGEVYFKTTGQINQMGYVVKYPDPDTIRESSVNEILRYVQFYVDAVLSENEMYTEYIDIDSFCSWLLIHDIMGNKDGGGSNIFLSKESMNDNSKMKLGPAWDFDGSFLMEDDWSSVHSFTGIMYFPYLLKNQNFRCAYQNQWKLLSDNFVEEIEAFLNSYFDKYGVALQESWNLGNTRYHRSNVSIEEILEETKVWFHNRKVWLDSAIETLE